VGEDRRYRDRDHHPPNREPHARELHGNCLFVKPLIEEASRFARSLPGVGHQREDQKDRQDRYREHEGQGEEQRL
jgi:hypothetical protein